jgi:carotenoid 1,2-hydratase
MRSPRRLRLSVDGRPWLDVQHTVVADDGPFYLRLLSEGTAPDGETATGWSEVCRPDRVDLARHRALVRMRVHRTEGRNSMWLPLFTGTREGRIRRLLGQVLGRGGG